MALLDRVKERVETDLLDPELTLLIAEAQAEIRRRWGPDRDTGTPISVSVDGGDEIINLNRPIDTDETVVVTEYTDTFTGESSTVLATNDYRVTNGGRTIRRLGSGTNSRRYWGDRIVFSYVPADDQAQRDEVAIELVKLAIAHEEVSSERVGDIQTSHLDYTQEREKLLGSLSPRPGLLMA